VARILPQALDPGRFQPSSCEGSVIKSGGSGRVQRRESMPSRMADVGVWRGLSGTKPEAADRALQPIRTLHSRIRMPRASTRIDAHERDARTAAVTQSFVSRLRPDDSPSAFRKLIAAGADVNAGRPIREQRQEPSTRNRPSSCWTRARDPNDDDGLSCHREPVIHAQTVALVRRAG